MWTESLIDYPIYQHVLPDEEKIFVAPDGHGSSGTLCIQIRDARSYIPRNGGCCVLLDTRTTHAEHMETCKVWNAQVIIQMAVEVFIPLVETFRLSG